MSVDRRATVLACPAFTVTVFGSNLKLLAFTGISPAPATGADVPLLSWPLPPHAPKVTTASSRGTERAINRARIGGRRYREPEGNADPRRTKPPDYPVVSSISGARERSQSRPLSLRNFS